MSDVYTRYCKRAQEQHRRAGKQWHSHGWHRSGVAAAWRRVAPYTSVFLQCSLLDTSTAWRFGPARGTSAPDREKVGTLRTQDNSDETAPTVIQAHPHRSVRTLRHQFCGDEVYCGQGRSQDFSLGATGRAPNARDENRGVRCGEGVSPLHWGWGLGKGLKFLNFYIKMVSSGAFWVAISYRLAACFTQIGSTCGTAIYWR